MPKYVIKWDAGHGEMSDLVEAENQAAAEECAYQAWREEAESNAEYSAEILTEDLAEEHGFEWAPND